MANTRTPRTRWVDAALEALANGGPDAVRIEALAREIGVTKGGFYWHFDGREALLEEMLDIWERKVVDQVITYVDSHGGDARAKLTRLFAVGSSNEQVPRMELAIRNWARHDAAIAERLRRVDNRRMDYMRSLFTQFVPDEDEVEVRCFLVFTVFIGTQFVVPDHGGRSRSEILELVTKRLLHVPVDEQSSGE